jgi:hypothetical protein
MRIPLNIVTGMFFVVVIAGFFSEPAHAQIGPQRPAVLNAPATPIGKVVATSGAVSIEHAQAVAVQASAEGQAAATKVGDLVYLGDGINFADGSAFSLSKNARMVLDEFVYDTNGKSNSTFFSLTNGTMTFVAGDIAKSGGMKVDTPVATMGIRGTTPHVEISNDGAVKFSTLIEEGKSKLARAHRPAAASQRIEQQDRFNPNICRGC